MTRGDGYTIAHRDELERTGGWSLVRRSLGLDAFGLNLVEIDSGSQIPEHDETERDQEEVFFILDGAPTMVIDGEDHPAPAGSFIRLRPERRRTVRNDAPEPAIVLIASAPCGSGYKPMEWA